MDAHRTLIKLFVVGLIGLLCLASNPYQAGGGADNVALAQSQFSLRHPSWINFGTSRGYNSASKYPHQGIDFATGNNPLVAAIDGTVTSVLENYNVISLAECRERGGTTVKVPERLFEIRHDSGYSLIYLHLSSFGKNPRTGGTWRVGDKIFAGEIVGISGDSGCTSGPHLHFAVKNPSGVYVNPENPSLWATFYPDDGYIDTPKNDTVVRDTVRISGWARVTRKYSPGGHPRTFYAPSSEGAISTLSHK